ncbi:MAG: MBL fold metallo-hydrolase [Clostridia bacterium]|nr:MBL fold metallo-hydrolase [Clostridia bacterium]
MHYTWLGHSIFLITNDAGGRLVTDPADEKSIPVLPRVTADVVTVSHRHHDHCAVERIGGDPVIKETPEPETFAGFSIRGYSVFHDEVKGAKRGPNTIFAIAADGARIVHCGDLGHIPDEQTIAAIKGCDVLLLPVGGVYTIDGRTAWEVAKRIAPKIVVPMHYQTPDLGFSLDPIEPFLAAAKADPAPVSIDVPVRG